MLVSYPMRAQNNPFPSTLPGLTLWLNSDSGITMNGPNVSGWNDLSGNNNHVIQSTTSLQPVYISSLSSINDHPVLRFDGSDDFMEILDNPSIDFASGMTIFIVSKQQLLSTNNCLLSKWDYGTQGSWALQTETGGAELDMFVANTLTDGGGNLVTTTNAGLSDSKFSIIGLVYDGTLPNSNRVTFYKNANLLTASTGGTIVSSILNSSSNMKIGKWEGLGRYYNGDIAEILIYNQALSALQKDSVEQYLHIKYAPPVSLGPDTTVCSFPIKLRAKKDYFTNYSWTGGSSDDSLVVNTTGTYTIVTTDVFGITSSDTIIISQDVSTYTVNLGSDISICSGQQAVINAGTSHLSYSWSTGSTSNSITVNTAGTYTVSVTDCLGGTSNDIINVNIVSPSFSLGNDTITCYNGNNPLILSPSVAGTNTYLWSNSSTGTSISVNASGTYWLQVSSSSCTSTDSINIQVDSFPQIATLGPDLTLCSGNSVYLLNGADSATLYSWSGVNNGTGNSVAVTNSGDYRLTVTDNNGCIKKDTIAITVNGVAPTPSFSYTNTDFGNSSQFTDVSSPQASIVNWSWSFGDVASGVNNSSTSQNPTHVFSSIGNFLVQLTVQNSSGCSNTLSQNVIITPPPFSSSTIPGLTLWLNSDSGITMNGPNVSGWNDLSGNNNNVIQTTASLQPLYLGSLSSINDHPALRFDGNDDFIELLDNATIDFVGGMTVFIVSKQQLLSQNKCLLSKWDFGTQGSWALQTETGGGELNMFVANAPNDAGGNSVNTTNAGLSDSEFSILGLVYDGTLPNSNRVTFNKNTNLLTASTGGTIVSSMLNSSSNMNIGKWEGLGRYYNGDIAEILIYNQALSALQKDSVEQYLHIKYAPPVSLGPDTTVCSFPIKLRAKKDYFANYAWTGGSTDDSLVVNTAGTYTIVTTDVFGFTSSDTIIITQDVSGYTVNLGSDISICSGQQTVLNAGPSHLTYLWSTGSTSNSITVNTAGTYSVSVTDCSASTSTDIINVTNVSPFFSLGNDTITCYNGNNPLLLSPNVSGTNTYLWSNSSVGTSLSVNASGTYWLLVSNSFSCFKIDTINILVDSFPQIAGLGPDVTICTGNSIYLTSGAAQAATYSWSDGSTNDSLLISSPVSLSNYSLTATSINGCIKKDTINVTIKGSAPTVAFFISTTCEGAATVFTDASSPPAGNSITSIDWDFWELSAIGSGTPASHIYADSGSYTAKLTITTDVGCTGDLSKTFTVYPYPVANFTTANLCERDSVLFSGSATDHGYPITQWNWNFADPASGANNTASIQNPKHLYASAATYTPISLTIQNAFGCATTINNSITIQPSPVTDFSTSLLCEKQSIAFTDNTTGTGLQGGSWNFGDGSAVSPLINPTHTYSVSGTYSISHVMTYTNTCSNTITKVLTVNPKPTALYATGNVCVSSPINFTDTSLISSGTITNWLWTFGAGGPTSTLQNAQYTFNTPVSPQIKLLVTSDQGCKDSITKTIVVRPLPVADFTYSPTNGSPPLAVTFTNTSTGAATYAWDFGDTNTDTQTNTSNTFVDTGSYNVTLIATTSFGCVDTVVKIVDALEPNLDVAVQNITAVLNNNFMTITAIIVNKGTVDVTSLQLTIRLDDGTMIQENWTGVLLRGGVLLDTITATIYLKDTKHFVCVSALKPNNLDDENPSDNESCIATDKSSFEVLEPYPVPAGESITLAVLIPNSTSNLEVNICNARGQIIRAIYSGVIAEGLQLFKIDLLGVAHGFYAFTVTYEGKTVVRKFVID